LVLFGPCGPPWINASSPCCIGHGKSRAMQCTGRYFCWGCGSGTSGARWLSLAYSASWRQPGAGFSTSTAPALRHWDSAWRQHRGALYPPPIKRNMVPHGCSPAPLLIDDTISRPCVRTVRADGTLVLETRVAVGSPTVSCRQVVLSIADVGSAGINGTITSHLRYPPPRAATTHTQYIRYTQCSTYSTYNTHRSD
jgi:hypothetical protein